MFDWIIEADVYRLRKAAREATNPRERRAIEVLAEQKLAILEGRTQLDRITASA
jgi:hypothetical protein